MVLENLLSNSIKYSPAYTSIYLRLQRKRGEMLIEVEDHGCGIPEDEQDKIFTKLYRTEQALVFDPHGSGLGLYLVKSLVEASGGRMWLHSDSNSTTFSVAYPLSGMSAKKGEYALRRQKR